MDAGLPLAFPSADRIEDCGHAREELNDRLGGLFTDPSIPYRPQFTGDYTSEWELAEHLCLDERGVRVNLGA